MSADPSVPPRRVGRSHAVGIRFASAAEGPARCEAHCDNSPMTGVHIGPDEGEKIRRGSRCHRVLAETPELEVIDGRFGPGFSVDPHTHRDHVDSFYVLEGEPEFTLGDEVVRAGPGTWVAAPIGTVFTAFGTSAAASFEFSTSMHPTPGSPIGSARSPSGQADRGRRCRRPAPRQLQSRGACFPFASGSARRRCWRRCLA
jgi:quercetin dioxygenase-like cupin family protein